VKYFEHNDALNGKISFNKEQIRYLSSQWLDADERFKGPFWVLTETGDAFERIKETLKQTSLVLRLVNLFEMLKRGNMKS